MKAIIGMADQSHIRGAGVKGKIGLEEHFAIGETLSDSRGFLPEELWPELSSRFLDVHEKRLRQMDQHGMEMMILSLNAPAVQAIIDPRRAIEVARSANDWLADQVAKRPDRFQALAALPMQDPDAAIRELERCVTELKFVGALVNGFSQANEANAVLYYDAKQYWPFWEVCERLDVPFYLHPRNPLLALNPVYKGHEWLLGPTWAFAAETSLHALRLIGSGLFDRHPRLQIILGHMGEGIPFNLWRIDNRNGWTNPRHKYAAKKRVADYFCSNFHVTTSGFFHTPTLIDVMLEMGAERILFSTDWPFENVDHASTWFDHASISETDRRRIGRLNALRLFKLPMSENDER